MKKTVSKILIEANSKENNTIYKQRNHDRAKAAEDVVSVPSSSLSAAEKNRLKQQRKRDRDKASKVVFDESLVPALSSAYIKIK